MSRKVSKKQTAETAAAARTGAEVSALVAEVMAENDRLRADLGKAARARNNALRYVIILEQQSTSVAQILADVLEHPVIAAYKAAGSLPQDLALDLERGTKALAGKGIDELLTLKGRNNVLGAVLMRLFPDSLAAGATVDALAQRLAISEWGDIALILRVALRRAEARASAQAAGAGVPESFDGGITYEQMPAMSLPESDGKGD